MATNGATGNISLTNAAATVDLGTVTTTLGGTLAVATTAGNITDSGVVTASGTSNFTTAGANDDITLNSGLAASGAITLSTAGTSGNATVVNTVGTTLAASTIGGNLDVNSSNNSMDVNGALSTAAANGTIVLNAGTNTLTTAGAGTIDAGTGTVTLTANSMALGGAINGTEDVTLKTSTTSRAINIAGGAGGLDLSTTELDLIAKNATRTIIVGDAAAYTGTMTLGAYNFGASSLTLNFLSGGSGDAVFNGTTQGTGAMVVNGSGNTATFNANQTWASQAIHDAVIIGGTGAVGGLVTLEATAGGITIDAPGGTVDQGVVASSLYLKATGNIQVDGAIGGTNALTFDDGAAADGLKIASSAGSVTINNIGGAGSGVTDSTAVSAFTTLTLTGTTYKTAGAQTYSAAGGIALTNGGTTTFTSSDKAITFNNAIGLNAGSNLVVTSAGGAITAGTIDGAAGTGETVTLTSTGGTAKTVAVGAIGTLAANGIHSVAITAPTSITLNGNITTDNVAGNTVTLTGPVILGANVAINTSASTGNIDLTSTVNNQGNTLTINNAVGSTATIAGIMSNSGGLTKLGTGTLVLTGNNTYGGLTTITGGLLQIGNNGTTGTLGTGNVNDNAALKFFRSDDLTAANVISGSGTLEKDGAGILTLSGANSYSGGTTITTGTLKAGDNSALGTGSVLNNATLDVGTFDVAGIGVYTQTNAASIFRVTVDTATTSGSLASTSAAVVNAGKVTVTNNVYVPNNRTFTVIDTTGSGVSALTTTQEGIGRADWIGSALNGDYMVTSDRSARGYAANAAGNPNAVNVGHALDNVTNPSSDMTTVLDHMEGLTPAQTLATLQTLTPDVSSGAAEGSRAMTSNSFKMISNRLGGARNVGDGGGVTSGDMTNGVGVWGQALGSNMKQDERKGVQGFSANTFGTSIGVDKVLDQHFRAGLAGSYGWAGVHSKQGGSPSDNINSYQATLYGSYDSLDLCKARQGGKKSYEAVRSQVENSWYVDGMAAFTENNYDSRREIFVTGLPKRVSKADHYGQQYSTNYEAGYKFVFEETKNLEVTPFAGLGYNYLYMNKYKEKGADAMSLHVQGEGFHQLEQSLGTKLAYPMVNQKMGTFIPSAKAAWLYDYIGDRYQTTASFAGGGPSFDTLGAKPAKNGILFGTELAFLNKGNMTVTGNWDIELKDQYMSNTYYGTVRYDF